MIKRIGLVVAALAAVLVIFAGARTFACGDHCKGIKSARAPESGSCCAHKGATSATSTAAVGCPSMKSANGSGCSGKATMAGGASCSTKASMTAGSSCGTMASGTGCSSKMSAATRTCCAGGKSGASKASYAANVYQVKDGHQFAVAQGTTFEVTATTPYYEAGSARYYFADQQSLSACAEKMAALTTEIDHEAVSLATAEGNVTADSYGRKYAVCPITHDKFLVTADSPTKVMDGEKYYVCSEKCWQDLMKPAVHIESEARH